MNNRIRSISLVASVLLIAAPILGQETISLSRQDKKSVSATAYRNQGTECRGVAIVSPGAGGSEQGYAYLGKLMSSLGYLSVVVGHQESGRRALRRRIRGDGLRGGLEDLITDPSAYKGRFMDIAAARDWAKSRCNRSESVLIGHSMGAATVMMEAGAKNKLGVNDKQSFDSYIAFSPQGEGTIFPADAWKDLKRPVLSITGTRDTELGGASWTTRTEPFKNMPPGCKWLGVIDGATHMNFAGRGLSSENESLIGRVIGAFLEGVRRKDCRDPKIRGIDLQTK